MANEHCTNELCVKRDTQLRLAHLREELLTNFNTLLIDRIRFLEQTITGLSSAPPSTNSRPSTISLDKHMSPEIIATNRLTAPLSLRRSSSATAYLLQSPSDPNVPGSGPSARSCPSSVDLTSNAEQRKWFLSIKNPIHKESRKLSEFHSTNLSIPINRQWTRSTNDLVSNTNVINDKGRLESRRFACDSDDNDVRTFKAMIYMEQARKQNVRPLTRLRQALGISSNSSLGNLVQHSLKKQTNS